jgi:uncharacterized protein YbbC (DUF1343 family)
MVRDVGHIHLSRRGLFAGAAGAVLMTSGIASSNVPPVTTGADVLLRDRFKALAGRRVGLITNQTGRVGATHLVDAMVRAGVKLVAIFAPEHGFRGTLEAGAKVANETDPSTGVRVFSLYGATRAPTPAMLSGLDVLVFDIQDIGARFYTYISTMGLAMQSAARAGIAFVVLDRPNPLGGDAPSGFVLEPALTSFVGQYPIPIVHAMTVAELAVMIKGERYLDGLDTLTLEIMRVEGWRRSMRWPDTHLPWVATSPNIPTFEAALVYPGIGIVGELAVNEGRGTPTPFSQFGAPWVDAQRAAERLAAAGLPGVRFEPVTYTPRAIANVAANPRFLGEVVQGVRLSVSDVAAYRPLETGMHAAALLVAEARAKRLPPLYPNLSMLHAIAGTRRFHALLEKGANGAAIVAAWAGEVATFKERRARYLLY